MRILHISLSAGSGGGPEHIYQLARQLRLMGVDNYFAIPCEEPYYSRLQPIAAAKTCEMAGRVISLLSFIRLLCYIKKHKIDIVHSHGKGAGLYGRLATLLCRVSSVHTFHGLHLNYSGVRLILYKKLECYLGKISATCIAVSSGEATQALKEHFCDKQKLRTIVNGVVIPSVISDAVNYPFSIVHISRFDVAKNSEMVCDIAKQLQQVNSKRFHFYMLGDGEGKSALMQRVEAEGLNKMFTFVGYTASPQAFLAGSLCCLSTSRWEGMPLALLEAMALGVPCIATDVVGNRDCVVHGETGFLFSQKNPIEAAKYIAELAQQDDAYKKMCKAARQRVEDYFCVKEMALKTKDVYTNVLLRE